MGIGFAGQNSLGIGAGALVSLLSLTPRKSPFGSLRAFFGSTEPLTKNCGRRRRILLAIHLFQASM